MAFRGVGSSAKQVVQGGPNKVAQTGGLLTAAGGAIGAAGAAGLVGATVATGGLALVGLGLAASVASFFGVGEEEPEVQNAPVEREPLQSQKLDMSILSQPENKQAIQVAVDSLPNIEPQVRDKVAPKIIAAYLASTSAPQVTEVQQPQGLPKPVELQPALQRRAQGLVA